MTDAATAARTAPFVLRAGEGRTHLVAGQIVRTLAGVDETAGGFGAVVCECPLDRGPIPMHWHEREHDTWFATRGKLQVWCGDESRVLTPGDFAYVKPGDIHSYRSVAPRTQFFGIVAPGGWEQFFADAGEVWGMTALPPDNHPFDFSRMGPAMAKHRIMRVDNPTYAEATAIGDADQRLPGGHESYFLEAGYGARHHLLGHLSTAVLTAAQSRDMVDMRVIEAGRGTAMPTLVHDATHLFLYVLDGQLALTIEGEEHRLNGGDAANIPSGTRYATRVLSGTARWLATSAGGNGGELWASSGVQTPRYSPPLEPDRDDLDRVRSSEGVDAAIA